MILEACVGNLKDAQTAESKGAHQIELCDRLDLDGTSPTIDCIEEVTKSLSIPIKVIINPNPFNYQYSGKDVEEILDYIDRISSFTISGLVFGPIDTDGMPDLKVLEKIAKCTDLPITYHKAIDASPDILKATKLLVDHGVISSILSSGGAETAMSGVDKIIEMNHLIERSKSNIYVIGAGKITNHNLYELDSQLGLTHYHGKLIVGDLQYISRYYSKKYT